MSQARVHMSPHVESYQVATITPLPLIYLDYLDRSRCFDPDPVSASALEPGLGDLRWARPHALPGPCQQRHGTDGREGRNT